MYFLNYVKYVVILIILQVYVVLSEPEINDTIVTISEGGLKGSIEELVDGSSYYSFKRIPYAAAPVGDLRFKAPEPPEKWEGLRDATEFGPTCKQYNDYTKTIQGDEDCLFLNVFTKTLQTNATLPVMVYIHGEFYFEGSNNLMPDYFLQHDVILVTFNYRLDLLGFLSLDIPEVPGNAGMKDQVAALQWIQKNIANFGGDSENVTIFGEDSGASSVTYHILSPMSTDLFHKAIAQSGVAIQDWAIGVGSKERAFRVGKLLGNDTTDVYELLEFFRSLDANALTNLTIATLTPDEEYRGIPRHFMPVAEKWFPGVEAFFTQDPMKMLVDYATDTSRVPLMLGYNSGDGSFLVKEHNKKLDMYNKDPSYYVPREISERLSEKKVKELGDRIKQYYFDDRKITERDIYTITNMLTDVHFTFNAHRFAHLYTYLCGNSYMYRFHYNTSLNIVKSSLGLEKFRGASHGDELFYMFRSNLTNDLYNEQELLKDIMFKITKLWTNFAKTGKPTPDNSLGVIWKKYSRDGKEYLNLGSPLGMQQYANKGRMEFWDNIYKDSGVQHLHGIFYPYQDDGGTIIRILSDNFCDIFEEEVENETYFFHPPNRIITNNNTGSSNNIVSKSSALQTMNTLYIILSLLVLSLR